MLWYRMIGLLLILSGLLSSCSDQRVSIETIPAYPDAAPLQPGEHPFADSTRTLFENIVGDQMTTQVQLYRLPMETTLENVKTFYGEQFRESDWSLDEAAAAQEGYMRMATWKRGNILQGEQILLIGFLPGEASNTMMVGLFSQ
ncbi:MAG: hypothetical protein HC837_17190 [Chloroflexaceae bacterium]|nr:hypothetical protein [Chloroflexaceae bacterium]